MAGDDRDGTGDSVWQVRVGPDGPVFDAPASQALLRSAEAAGVPLPASCRNGTCRTCIQRVRSGQVRHAIEWPGLSAQEKDEGWILPCVALPCSNLELDDPWAHQLPVT